MRTTKTQVEGAFKRLHRAMEWPIGPAYKDGKPNIGAVYLSDNGFTGWGIEIIVNEGGGVNTPFASWGGNREAFDTMAAMSDAVESFKRDQ